MSQTLRRVGVRAGMRWAWVLAVVSTSSVALGQATPPPAASRFDAALGRARDGRAAFEKHQAPKRVGRIRPKLRYRMRE